MTGDSGPLSGGNLSARWWGKSGENDVTCGLCFRRCRLSEGAAGVCGVRFNAGGTLVSPWLGRFAASAVDPVEKKPLAHWRPGSFIFSLGSVGCTMDCPFCQNHTIARPAPGSFPSFKSVPFLPPQTLVREVRGLGLDSVAFTYNEPTLQAEYVLEAAPLLREAGIALVLVTNGALSKEASDALMPWVDAANIDLKAFTPEGYRRLGGDLEAVKAVITSWVRGGVHVELTNLVVPGLNDNRGVFAAMADWIAALSPDIPLHISRCFPRRNYFGPPTDIGLLHDLAAAARTRLSHVHLGNV
ncbi:MAG: radical SAM protein [Fretibacterium sp.]|nr:radical SAM protein [Fretibacterium sp.]